MNKDAIDEIAAQLGIATEQAQQYIHDILPQYAAVVVGQKVATLVIIALIAAIFFTVAFLADKASKSENISYSKQSNYEDVWVFATVFSGIMLFALVIAVAVDMPQIVGWSISPDAMLVKTIVDSMGR